MILLNFIISAMTEALRIIVSTVLAFPECESSAKREMTNIKNRLDTNNTFTIDELTDLLTQANIDFYNNLI